jgi:catechol 2,3-dioxygenase-like lactoylglutathione lyase family enzyme
MKKLPFILTLLAATAALAILATPTLSANKPESLTHIEHIGLNVPDVAQTVDWFAKNLDMKIARKTGDPSNAHFLTDAAGRNMLEIYSNTGAPIPDYKTIHPLTLHIAFSADDIPAAHNRLIQAGATPEGDIATTPVGDTLAMLRTPQGIPIQLTKRANPMLK